MARRRPRHGQNAASRAYVFPVLVTLALLICGPMVLQVHGAIPLKLAVAAATIITIITWQVWRQKRRAGLGASERPPAERPGYTSAEPPQKEDTPPLSSQQKPHVATKPDRAFVNSAKVHMNLADQNLRDSPTAAGSPPFLADSH